MLVRNLNLKHNCHSFCTYIFSTFIVFSTSFCVRHFTHCHGHCSGLHFFFHFLYYSLLVALCMQFSVEPGACVYVHVRSWLFPTKMYITLQNVKTFPIFPDSRWDRHSVSKSMYTFFPPCTFHSAAFFSNC